MQPLILKVTNHKGIELEVGDRIKIISEYIGSKALANVELGEILTITGFSDNGKIIYHNNTLALPVNSDVYIKL